MPLTKNNIGCLKILNDTESSAEDLEKKVAKHRNIKKMHFLWKYSVNSECWMTFLKFHEEAEIVKQEQKLKRAKTY